MSEIFLKPAELSYLLQTFNAQSVLGVDDAELFPQNEAEKNVLLKEGRDLLIEHGWLTADEEGRLNFNPELAYLAAVMVDPNAVVLTLEKAQETTRQLVAHYLADEVIVEQLRRADGRYQLAFVQDLDTAVARIESAFQLNKKEGDNNVQIFLSTATFAQVKEQANEGDGETAVSLLQQAGLNAPAAISLVQAMQAPRFQGMAVVLQRDGEVTSKGSLSVHQGHAGCWLICLTSLDDSHIVLEEYTPQGFRQHLTGFLENQAVGN